MPSKNIVCVWVAFLCCAAGICGAQQVDQARGVDQRVDYRALAKFGPWDDRNYQLSQKDLSVLAPNEEELIIPIPAFFRVELRKMIPSLRKDGPIQYPRAAVPLFQLKYGGLQVNGRIIGVEEEAGSDQKTEVPVSGEIKLNTLLGANEVTIEINPVFPDHVIAGSNNNGGQEMYYSDDGGLTWTIAGVLPSTCCDPTLGWSSNGLIAYAGALSSAIGVNFYKSTDFGHTWGAAKVITPSGSDKEFLHVDLSPSSPFKDNVYLTYHNNNVLQFARSADFGANFNITAFTTAPEGIGSDITTDPAGNVYYCYAATGTQQIILLKSTNGGASFGAPQVIATTNGSFDYPIPAMESRRAWTYAACDADRSGGAFDGSIYVSWTDTTAAESGVAANNHTQVKVAYSRNGGSTWTVVIPHETADVNTVDRFNQWITVDENGVVHVVYYDTRHSLNRTGVDLYYTFSVDGAVSWNTPARITSATSGNLTDGQEWGDYNGLSVFGTKVLPVWTDNREGPPNSKDVYSADVLNVTAEPTFTLASANPYQNACRPETINFSVDVGQTQSFSNPVTLSFDTLPAGITGSITPNPVTPPGIATVQINVANPAAAGENDIIVNGTAAGTGPRQITLVANVLTGTVSAPVLSAPANGAATGLSASLAWGAVAGATEYRVQMSSSAGFSPLLINQLTSATSQATGSLTLGQTYYWRVAAINDCGQGSFSTARNFTASLNEYSSSGAPLAIPDNNPGGVSSQIHVPVALTITKVSVKLNITHTWDSDLQVLLQSPAGTQITLFNAVGGSGDNFVNTVLDDAAPTAITAGTAPFTGSFRPATVLSTFNGQSSQENWTLTVKDLAASDLGTLNNWTITLEGTELFNGNAVWVQFSYAGTEVGTSSQPFNTLAEGVAAVNAGGEINVKSGSTPATSTISKAATLKAIGGTVSLGKP